MTRESGKRLGDGERQGDRETKTLYYKRERNRDEDIDRKTDQEK